MRDRDMENGNMDSENKVEGNREIENKSRQTEDINSKDINKDINNKCINNMESQSNARRENQEAKNQENKIQENNIQENRIQENMNQMKRKMELIEEIQSYIDEEEAVDLCQRLIQIPSENPPGDMREITEFVCSYLGKNALEYEILEETENKPIIISRISGNQEGKTLILNVHLDVVPAGDSERWEIPPYAGVIREGYLHGRGASDMKGGAAGLLTAFKAASKVKELPGQLVLTLVPDEETGGHYGSRVIVERLKLMGDGCLIGEPSATSPTVGQKGACFLKVVTGGRPGHGSLSPVEGDNAILKMYRALQVIYSIWEREWKMPPEIEQLLARSKSYIKNKKEAEGIEMIFDRVTVNVGTIRGGTKVNIIPDRCEAEVDLRLPFGVEPDKVLEYLRTRLKKEGVEAEITHSPFLSRANYTLPEEGIVQAVLLSAEKRLGQKIEPTLQWASSDARFFRNAGIPTVQLGPADLGGIHSYNEKVSVEDLKIYTRMYGDIVVDFLYQ